MDIMIENEMTSKNALVVFDGAFLSLYLSFVIVIWSTIQLSLLQPFPKWHEPNVVTLEFFHIFMIPCDYKKITAI